MTDDLGDNYRRSDASRPEAIRRLVERGLGKR